MSKLLDNSLDFISILSFFIIDFIFSILINLFILSILIFSFCFFFVMSFIDSILVLCLYFIYFFSFSVSVFIASLSSVYSSLFCFQNLFFITFVSNFLNFVSISSSALFHQVFLILFLLC